MSIFNSIKNIFSPPTDNSDYVEWRRLSDTADLKEIKEASYSKLQLIYKHSTRCATSYFALKNLQNFPKDTFDEINTYLVDVIGQRDLSGEISKYFNVRHESPQVIILKNGEVIWSASHGHVRTELILEAIK
jgi:bacillithiol system protein YtxJ